MQYFVFLILLRGKRPKLDRKKYDFSTGFYYSQNPVREIKASPQIDIICYDRINYPVLFDDNETLIVTPTSVKGLIEIKSTITKNAIEQILINRNCLSVDICLF